MRSGPVAFLLLLLMTAAFLWPVLAEGRVFYYGDFDKFFYPAKLLVAKALAAGRLPLWDSTQMGGLPVLAHPLYGALYPPSLILALLPFHLGLGVFLALHFVLAGLFTYYLLREWGLSPASCMVSALSFSFGGVMVASANVPPILQTMTWFPMMALSFRRAISRGSGVYLVLSALALALMFYGGEVHLAYAAVMVLFLWAVVETVRSIRRRGEPTGSHAPNAWPPIAFVVIMLVGVFLSFPLLLPSGVLVSFSTRASGMSLEDASQFSLSPGRLLGFMIPSLFFDKESIMPWYEVTGVYRTGYFLSLYVGAVPLALSFIGMATRGIRNRWLFLAFLLLLLMAAMGRNLPLFPLIHRYVPFMGMFRYPEKFLVFSAFFLALFSGFGAEALLRRCSHERAEGLWSRSRAMRTVLIWFLPWVLIVGFVAAYSASHRGWFISFVKWADVFNMPLSGKAEDYRAFHRAVTMDLVKFDAFLIAGMALAIVAVLTKKGRLLLGPALVVLTALALFVAHRGVNATTPAEYYLSPPLALRYMEKEGGPHRVYPLIFEKKKGSLPLAFSDIYGIYLWEKEALKPNIGAVWGIQYADSESALRLSAQSNLINRIVSAPPGVKEKLLGIYNVKYMLAPYNSEEEIARRHDQMELVHRFQGLGILLYRNKRYLPRAYYVPSVRVVGTDKQALSALLDERFDPSKEVVITASRIPNEPLESQSHEGPAEVKIDSPPLSGSAHAGLKLSEYRDSQVSVDTDFGQGGYLVLSDVYYPGWAAVLDGKPVEILRANYLFRAVKLPAGKHSVRFSYTPRDFMKGVYGGLPMAALGIILILAFHFSSRRQGPKAPAEKNSVGEDASR